MNSVDYLSCHARDTYTREQTLVALCGSTDLRMAQLPRLISDPLLALSVPLTVVNVTAVRALLS